MSFLTSMDLAVIASISSNIVAAVGLILINKWVLVVNKFPFTTVLCCLHYYVSFVACCFLLLSGVFRYKSASKYDYILRISLGALASTVFNNLNLAYNSVGLYQISKLMCIPITLIIETLLQARQQDMTTAMVTSLLMIMFGVSMFVFQDPNKTSHTLGYIWAALAVISTSLSQIFFGPLQKVLDLNPLQLLYYTSPLLTLGSFILIPIFESRENLMNTNLSYSLVWNLFFSCLGAVMLNLTNYFVLSHTTPLTYLVLGHIKTLLILILGYVFFERKVPSINILLGIVIALGGVVLYSFENLRQQQEKGKMKPSTPIFSNNGLISNGSPRKIEDI